MQRLSSKIARVLGAMVIASASGVAGSAQAGMPAGSALAEACPAAAAAAAGANGMSCHLGKYDFKVVTFNADRGDTSLPLVLAMHWSSSSPDELLAAMGPQTARFRMLLPQGRHPKRQGFSFFPADFYARPIAVQRAQATSEASDLAAFVAEAHGAYGCDAPLLVTGVSQGGDLSFQLALSQPALVKAGIALLGRALAVESQEWKHASPVIAYYGGKDEIVTPAESTRYAEALARNGADLEVRTFPGAGHEVTPAMAESLRADIARLLPEACDGRPSVPPHVTFTMASDVLGEERLVNVYLPPVHLDADERIATMYMPDGGVQEDFGHVANAIDQAIRAGEMQPVVLVGIENTQRRRDMTGPTTAPSDREIAPAVGGSAKFRHFIKQELIPEIERRFPVGDQRGIIGESLAGLFVLETLAQEPTLFQAYIALSPSLWWNHGSTLRDLMDSQRQWPATTVLYAASANEDNIRPHIETMKAGFAGKSRTRGWVIETHPDLSHATIYRALAPRAVRHVFPPLHSVPVQ